MSRKRRGRGEGSIHQRKDNGLWVTTISLGYGADGKRNRKTIYGKTKKEVQGKLKEFRPEQVEPSSMSVEQYLQQWLDSIRRTVATVTWTRRSTVVRLHLAPFIGTRRLSTMSPLVVDKLYADLEAAGRSSHAVRLAGTILGTALQQAVRLQLIPANPVTGSSMPAQRTKEFLTWSRVEVKQFLAAAASDRLSALYTLALTTGMRQGELFALQWRDIDFDAQTVTVNRSLEEVRGEFNVKPPKTKSGRRSIIVPPSTIAALLEHRKAMLAEGHATSPVFCARDGGWLRKSNVQRRSFKPAIEAAGVPAIRFHDLRHTHATLLLQDGEHIKVVSERLGHASVETTLRIYAHVLPSMQQSAADRIGELLA